MTMNIKPCCPTCFKNLELTKNAYSCTGCSRAFPLVYGIPDLRISDPFFFSKEKESKEIDKLLDKYESNSFEDLVKLRFDPDTPKDLLQRYLRSWLGTVERNSSLLKKANQMCNQNKFEINNKYALDVGCGSGGMLVALSSEYEHVIGIDVSMHSLIYAKKLLEENNCKNVSLYCCGLDYLPFEDNTFNMVSASNVIEHLQDQEKAIGEIHRLQKKDGVFFGDIPNRYSLRPEPHVNLKFVGFMPRKLAVKYVWLMRKRNYEGYNLPSYYDLTALFNRFYSGNDFLIESFVHLIEGMKKPDQTKNYIHSLLSRINSFLCHYYIVVARKS